MGITIHHKTEETIVHKVAEKNEQTGAVELVIAADEIVHVDDD